MIKLNKELFIGMALGFGTGVALGALAASEKNKEALKNAGQEAIRVAMQSYEKLKDSLASLRETIETLADDAENEIEAEENVIADSFQSRRRSEPITRAPRNKGVIGRVPRERDFSRES